MTELKYLLKAAEITDNTVLIPACIREDGKEYNIGYERSSVGDKTVLSGEGEGLKDVVSFSPVNEGFICERYVHNVSAKPLKLKETAIYIRGLDLCGAREADYFYCNENVRLYGVYTLPIDYDRLNPLSESNARFGIETDSRYVDPGAIGERILISPYQPFPAIHLGNYARAEGLVHGSLSQEVFYHNYTLRHEGAKVNFNVYSSFKSVGYRLIAPGERLRDMWYMGVTANADDIDRVFENYTARLKPFLKGARAPQSPNKSEVVWGSWNDGVYRNVSEELLIREAKVLKKLFPSVRWLLLDDGYSAYCAENVDLDAHGLGVAYEGENGIDKKKFPSGLKGYTDKIKEAGLRPSIWIGGWVPHNAALYKDHPEWFADYKYRTDFASPLDVSVKEVREYMTFALDRLLTGSGFEGIKHDFWSYAFEDSKDILKNKDKSGYEYRDWWLSEIRKRIPQNGYMQSGCDLCMGNPFLGKYFDNYRFGLDIGSGNWEKVKTTLFWGCACFSVHTGDAFIPNGDAIGLMRGLTDTDFMFLLNYLLITHSLVELSGLFSTESEHTFRVKRLQRALNGLNNGADVYFAKFDYRKKGAGIPEIMYSLQPCFADKESKTTPLCTVALFNAGETFKELSVSSEDCGLKGEGYVFTEVWQGKEEGENAICVNLSPHESKLYYIIRK